MRGGAVDDAKVAQAEKLLFTDNASSTLSSETLVTRFNKTVLQALCAKRSIEFVERDTKAVLASRLIDDVRNSL